MTNDYKFWNNYLLKVLNNLKKLAENKENIYADFHMHTDYSVDSTQSLMDIINHANSLGLDIISITDHDSIRVYDELFEILKKDNIKMPIIIPGVEFTIDNGDYGSQFHILQLMINPKDENILKDIKHQEEASWIRAKKQIERLNANKAINYFLEKNNISYTLNDYKEYLNTCYRPIPEYKTMMNYISFKLYKYNITNWDILDKMREYNETDDCNERKEIKTKEYIELENKYSNYSDSEYNDRFFHRLLATRGCDDDFFPNYKIMGDLSVNNYDELKLEDLNRNFITVFAHPSENKLALLEELIKLNDNILGIELNKRCKYTNLDLFNDIKRKLDLSLVIGSDCHDLDSDLYDDLEFYNYNKNDLNRFIELASNYIDK